MRFIYMWWIIIERNHSFLEIWVLLIMLLCTDNRTILGYSTCVVFNGCLWHVRSWRRQCWANVDDSRLHCSMHWFNVRHKCIYFHINSLICLDTVWQCIVRDYSENIMGGGVLRPFQFRLWNLGIALMRIGRIWIPSSMIFKICLPLSTHFRAL